MKRRLGTSQLDMTVNRVFPQAKDFPLGIELECHPVKEVHTEKQRRGWHYLLGQWFELDPQVAKNSEHLKDMVLISMFGGIKLRDEHGNEHLMPARRTTSAWDWGPPPRYRSKQLPREQYIDLIEHTYYQAQEDGIILPTLEADITKRKKAA